MLALALFLICVPQTALATGGGHGGGEPLDLNILVTNDDGFDSAGLAALRQALIDAGHTVTLVAPLSQQSGKGGSINTAVLNFDVGDGTRLLLNVGDGMWAFDGSPSNDDFPSTIAAYAPSADFIARLADGGNFDLPLFDPRQGFPSLGVPPLPFPSCADATAPGDSCFVSVGIAFPTGADPVVRSDTNAIEEGYISVTPMNADMTANFFGQVKTAIQLKHMTP